MRVFILEDDPDRIRLFAEWLKDDDWECIHTCERAHLFKPPYDLVLLDHDLGGRQMQEHEDCGLTFCGLVGDKLNHGAYVIAHSWNPDGAKAMLHTLYDQGHRLLQTQPFGPTLARLIQERREVVNHAHTTTGT